MFTSKWKKNVAFIIMNIYKVRSKYFVKKILFLFKIIFSLSNLIYYIYFSQFLNFNIKYFAKYTLEVQDFIWVL